jgi:PleD family two-component response regulator
MAVFSAFPDNGKGIKQLIDAADKALYMAKDKGRKRVCTA